MKLADLDKLGLPVSNVAFWLTGVLVFALLAVATLLSRILHRSGRITESLYGEVISRIRTWAIIVPVVLIPIALGPLGVRAAAVALGLLCFGEFSRASGLAQSRWLARSGMVAVAILASGCIPAEFAPALYAGVFATLTIIGLFCCDSGKFLQQVSLAAIAVAWLGICLGSLGKFASEDSRIIIVLWLVLCVELNDVAAFIGGKLMKGRKLCPRISPGKTVSGAVTALVATTIFAGISAGWYWESTTAWLPFVLGFMIAAAGQLGDLVISAMKRSLGIKDLGRALPGHGGLLDRCDSLIFAAPVVLFPISFLAALPQ